VLEEDKAAIAEAWDRSRARIATLEGYVKSGTDMLRENTTRIAELKAHLAEHEACDRANATVVRELEDHRDELEALLRRWREAARGLPLAPGSPGATLYEDTDDALGEKP
jgi:hypothetical protein